jgi:hypothetical protein
MRFYSFVNGLYMNSLQYGLQTAHAVSEVSLLNSSTYNEWANSHKTIIILDATNLAGLKRVLKLLDIMVPIYNAGCDPKNAIPYSPFHEDMDSLGGVMTCVGAVIPADVYECEMPVGSMPPRDVIASFEHAVDNQYAQIFNQGHIKYLLCSLLKSYNLAPR